MRTRASAFRRKRKRCSRTAFAVGCARPERRASTNTLHASRNWPGMIPNGTPSSRRSRRTRRFCSATSRNGRGSAANICPRWPIRIRAAPRGRRCESGRQRAARATRHTPPPVASPPAWTSRDGTSASLAPTSASAPWNRPRRASSAHAPCGSFHSTCAGDSSSKRATNPGKQRRRSRAWSSFAATISWNRSRANALLISCSSRTC